VPQPQPVELVIQGQPEVILVDINDNVDEVFRNVQQKNIGAHNNIANLVEYIMAQNGLIMAYIGHTLFLLCRNWYYNLNFLGVIKFLSSPNLQEIPVSPLSNISQGI